MKNHLYLSALTLGLALLLLAGLQAANHREAPLTALDHKADITDFFAFVSPRRMGRAERNPSFRGFDHAMGFTSFYPSYGLNQS